MFSVNPEIVERLDRQAEKMSLKRTQLSHTALSLGLMLFEGMLDQKTLKDLLDKSVITPAQPTSLTKEPKAQPARRSVKKAKPETTAPLSIDALCEEPPSSPAESVSDTLPPTEPIEASDPSEDLLEAVLSQVDEAELIASGRHPTLNTHGKPWTGNPLADH